jgi:hypothetical protein
MSRRNEAHGTVIKDQPPAGGCDNCGGPVRWRKEHPAWGYGWFCSKCVRTARPAGWSTR